MCVGLYRKRIGIDAPGFASPIHTYRQNLSKMRKSNDPSGSEPTNLCSLGVVDLDLTVCPDVFGLRAFETKKPVTRMLPGSNPCDLRLLIPDTTIGQDGFHDVVIENLIGTSTWRSIQPSVMILGASTMQRTLPSSLSLTVATPAEGTVMADVESIHSVSSLIDPSDRSQVDVTSAPLISVPAQVESQVVEIDLSCVIHPFYIHKMDSGPVRLMTIAHDLLRRFIRTDRT